MSIDLNKSKNIWKSEYNIGNLQIDKEHQNLFSLARKAINIDMSKDENDIYCDLKELITQLYRYVNLHFANEEAFMRKIHYGEYEIHKQIHKNIIAGLNNLLLELNNLELSEIKMKLYEFINEKFIHHIITEDKKIHIWNTSIDDLKKHFGWKEIYSVGNEAIDEEHKRLFEIAKEALEEKEFNDERSNKIVKVIRKLYEYMKIHFKHEEELMEESNYPQLEKHKEIHREIINTINAFVKQLPTMETEIFEKELIKLIDIVLIQHIIQEDRKIINWVKAMKKIASL